MGQYISTYTPGGSRPSAARASRSVWRCWRHMCGRGGVRPKDRKRLASSRSRLGCRAFKGDKCPLFAIYTIHARDRCLLSLGKDQGFGLPRGGRPSLLGRKFLGKKRGPEEPLILLSAWLDGGFEFRAYRRSAEPEILGFHSLHFKPVDELCNLKGFSGFFIADGFGVLKCSPD